MTFVFIALGAVVFEIWLRRRWSWVILLRAAWIIILGFILADYNRIHSKSLSQPETLHILFDRSSSVLDLKDRRDRLEGFLSEIRSWVEERKQPVQILSFGDQVRAESFDLPKDSTLKTLLRPAEEDLKNDEGAVVLISDGRWSDSIQLKRPVYAVQLGETGEKDVWIENLQPTFTAFLKNRLKVPIDIGQEGFAGKSVRVSLWLGDEKVDEKEVELQKGLTRTELSYFPERMGENIFVARVTALTGELSDINNQSTTKIRTVRDKMRILHIGGKPSVDLKAWRFFLTRQPDVDMVSFYILRTISNDPEAKNSELSLIPFPYEELFSMELSKFDVVILQNFDFNLYFPASYLTNLAAFVRDGGGLLIIGGDQGIHRYQYSPLESIFPFEYERGGAFERSNASVDDVGSHPIVKGLELSFQKMFWTGFHQLKHRETATDLVQLRGGIPLLSIRAVDRGRIVSVNTDESWKLQMQPTAEIGSFSKLARRTLQYLTFDPEMEVQKLLSSRWQAGQEVKLQLKTGESSNWVVKSLFDPKFERRFSNQTEIKFVVPAPGPYTVQNSNLQDLGIFETEEQPWRDEWKHLLASDEKMKRLAESTQGKWLSFKNRKEIFDESLTGRQILSASVEPWTAGSSKIVWSILFFAIVFMCCDFYFRKKINWDA